MQKTKVNVDGCILNVLYTIVIQMKMTIKKKTKTLVFIQCNLIFLIDCNDIFEKQHSKLISTDWIQKF